MGKWRDETKTLVCGCRVGRSGSGQWFYDFICKYHLKGFYFDGKYSYEKALEMTEKLNRQMIERKFRPDQCPDCQLSKGTWCYIRDGEPILMVEETNEKCKDFKPRRSIGDCPL